MKLNEGDYISLIGMSLDGKQKIAEHLAKDNKFAYSAVILNKHNYISTVDGFLCRIHSFQRDICNNNLTLELLSEMSLSSSNSSKTKPNLPKEFKVRNGHLPEVRKWLSDNVTDRIGADAIENDDSNSKFLLFNEFAVGSTRKETVFNAHHWPELIIHTGVTGWEIKDDRKSKLKKRQKELELELDEIEKELSAC